MSTIIIKESYSAALNLAERASRALNLWIEIEPFGSNEIDLWGQDQSSGIGNPRFEIIFPREDEDYEA